MRQQARILAVLFAAIVIAVLIVLVRQTAPTPYKITSQDIWTTRVAFVGTASPRVGDFNGDGFLDVVVGGGIELKEGSVTAVDGNTGNVLWQTDYPDEILITMPLLDVNGDDTVDVFVGGRHGTGDFYALSGVNGKTLWSLATSNPDVDLQPINFMNVLLVNDLDNDGMRDLIVVQTGGQDRLRIPGQIHFVNSVSGKILNTHTAPDSRECYSAPILFEDEPGTGDLYIGTGGETLRGNLLKLQFPSMNEAWRMSSEVSVPAGGNGSAIRLSGKGFVASPLLCDVDGNGRHDLIASAMNGTLYRIDAATGTPVWNLHQSGYETYSSPTIGRFSNDESYDIVAAFSKGVFPKYEEARLSWVDGATGQVMHDVEFGKYQFNSSSPLVLDANGDGRDEVLITVTKESNPYADESKNKVIVFDGGASKQEVFRLEFPGFSAATPCLVDLDDDNTLDMIHVYRDHVTRLGLTIDLIHPPASQPESPSLPFVSVGRISRHSRQRGDEPQTAMRGCLEFRELSSRDRANGKPR